MLGQVAMMLQGTFLLLLCATAHGALPLQTALQTALQTGEGVPVATETQPSIPTAREMLAAEQAAGVPSDDASPVPLEKPCDRAPCDTGPSAGTVAESSATESATPGPAELSATTYVETTNVPGTDIGGASAGPCGVPDCPDAAT